ncbi:MAG: type II secretion system protein [Candidatus Paceibacterota bacterium]
MQNKGFTLIELLVVIAIIGILASIVMVALGGARKQARDARITSEMGQIRSKAELAYSSNGEYTGFDCSGDEMSTLCDDIDKQCHDGVGTCGPNDADGGDQDVEIHTSNDAYCAFTGLNTGGYYCIDSTGQAVEASSTPNCTDSSTDCN